MNQKSRKAGKIWKPGTHEEQRIFLLSCFPDSLLLISWVPDSFLFSFVHDEFVSVRITKLRHPANWRLGLLKVEANPAFL